MIDTNIRFVNGPLDGDLSCLNIDIDDDPDIDPTETPLTGSRIGDAYVFRNRERTLQDNDKK